MYPCSIIGGKGCPAPVRITTILKSDSTFALLHEKWSDVGRSLGTPAETIYKIRQDLLLSKISLGDAVTQLLEDWTGRLGRGATFQNLISALESNGMKSCAETLESSFKLITTTTTAKSYSQMPTEIQKYLTKSSSTSASECLIVSTPDVLITWTKMSENDGKHYCTHFNRFEEFLGFLSLAGNERLEVVVAGACSMGNLTHLFKEVSPQQLSKMVKKLVLLTTEAKSALHELLKRAPIWSKRMRIAIDNMEWDHLTLSKKDQIRREASQQLRVNLESAPAEALLCGQVLVDLINKKGPKLFKSTLPEPLTYYVPRELVTRTLLTPQKIFENRSSDIFVFTGMDRVQLSRAVGGATMTRTSSEQLRLLTVRFILLDQSSHFEKICQKSEPTTPVHWIQAEEEGQRLRWLRSKPGGSMSEIQKCVDKAQEQERVVEDKILEVGVGSSAVASSPVCITDSPGMGKTVLLAQLGRKLEVTWPGRVVLFVELSEFILEVKRCGGGGGGGTTGKRSAIASALSALTCENRLGTLVLESKLDSSSSGEILIELLLDGLDEVDPADWKLSYGLIKQINETFNSVRLWITSRPHLLSDLENSLSVLGYNMQPFSEANQISFLGSFWNRVGGRSLDTSKLAQFASVCLAHLKSNMSSTDGHIAGIPLQTLLIGEVFEEEAVEFCESVQFANISSLRPSSLVSINSVTDLFKCLVAKKFQKYFTVHVRSDFAGLDNLQEMHVRLSLELIFPAYLPHLEKFFGRVEVEMAELLKIGVVESSPSGGGGTNQHHHHHRFIHRTFAEYFIAVFVMERVRGVWENEEEDSSSSPSWGRELTTFLFEHVTGLKEDYELAHPVICHFLDKLIPSIPVDAGSLLASKYFVEPFRSEELMKRISRSFAYDDFVNIFNFIDRLGGFCNWSGVVFDEELLRIVVEFSSVEFVKLVAARFEEVHHHELSSELKVDLLREAIQRGEFSIVEFLLKELGLVRFVEGLEGGENLRLLLHNCVKSSRKANSDEEGVSQIESKCQVVQLLAELNPSLLEERDEDGRPPLLSQDVHIQLLLKLVELGANLLAQDYGNNTLLHLSPEREHLSAEEYHSLLLAIPAAETLRQLVGTAGQVGKTPLVTLLESLDPVPETLQLLAELEVVAELDFHPILRTAIIFRRSAATLKYLLELASTSSLEAWTGGNGNRYSILHLTAMHGNLEALQVLQQDGRFGANLNLQNDHGMTPLDCAIHGPTDLAGSKRTEVAMALRDLGGLFNDSSSTLHLACHGRKASAVRLLLHFGLDPNEQDDSSSGNNSPLHLSLSYFKPGLWLHSFETVQVLLEFGADPNLVNGDGLTPLELALTSSHLDLDTLLLLKSKSDFRWSPRTASLLLGFLFRSGNYFSGGDGQVHHPLVAECEAHGADYGFDDDEKGNTFLHNAASAGDLRTIAYLLEEKEGNVNGRNLLGESPLHKAVWMGDIRSVNLEVVTCLLDYGADGSIRDAKNETFLHCLFRNSLVGLPIPPALFHEVVQLLDERGGARIWNEQGGISRATPLQLAASGLSQVPEDGTLEMLVKGGADFNAVDKMGDSVLNYAVRGGAVSELLGLLIACGADPGRVNNKGKSCLHVAAKRGSVDGLKLLLGLELLDVNGRDAKGNGPVHYAGYGRRNGREVVPALALDKCQILLEHGANPRLANNQGETPLTKAMRLGNLRLVKLFEGIK